MAKLVCSLWLDMVGEEWWEHRENEGVDEDFELMEAVERMAEGTFRRCRRIRSLSLSLGLPDFDTARILALRKAGLGHKLEHLELDWMHYSASLAKGGGLPALARWLPELRSLSLRVCRDIHLDDGECLSKDSLPDLERFVCEDEYRDV